MRSLACRSGGAGSVQAGAAKNRAPLSFFSEAQNGLQEFRVVRAAAQNPEEVGPREAGEPFFVPVRNPSRWQRQSTVEEMVLFKLS